MPISPHAQPPGPSMHVGTASRRGERIGRRQGRALAALLMAAGATIGATGCAQATTTSAGSPSIAASDLERIASGNKSPGSSSSAASSFATSGTSGSGQFVVPEAAKAHTKEGAVAFVKFYWNMLGELDERPQPGIVPTFSEKGCTACQRQEGTMKRLAQKKQHVTYKNSRMADVGIRGDSTPDQVVVQFHQTDEGGLLLTSGGNTVKKIPAVNDRLDMLATWDGKGWKIGEEARSSH